MNILAEWTGWLATTVVVSSFLFANPTTLRIVQIFGAMLWLSYGAMIDSLPVVAANALIVSAATLTILLRARRMNTESGR